MNKSGFAFRTFGLTALAMIAFAANSVLGRLGLVDGEIGPASFAAVRLVSGAVLLAFLAGPRRSYTAGNWSGAASLFVYAAFFSYAYLTLPAGTGALILFAIVQITMVGTGLVQGERLRPLQMLGLAAALAGLVYLVSPGLAAPPLIGAMMMALAGLGWGVYSLLGRSGGDPTLRTAGNFVRASMIAGVTLLPLLILTSEPTPTFRGLGLAILSGAVTSGLGYALWYSALKSLSAVKAGVAQLTVPALAALGGILFLSEPLTLRFIAASLAILGGVACVTVSRASKT